MNWIYFHFLCPAVVVNKRWMFPETQGPWKVQTSWNLTKETLQSYLEASNIQPENCPQFAGLNKIENLTQCKLWKRNHAPQTLPGEPSKQRATIACQICKRMTKGAQLTTVQQITASRSFFWATAVVITMRKRCLSCCTQRQFTKPHLCREAGEFQERSLSLFSWLNSVYCRKD